MDQNTHIYDRLREMSGGRLPVPQFNAAKNIIESGYRGDFRIALGLAPEQANDQRLSENGRKFIQGYEKLRLKAYMPTPNDRPTIGWGTTFYPNGKPVQMGDVITAAQADEYFKHDVRVFEDYVNEIITRTLTQNQFDAIVSLVYNIGMKAFRDGSVDDKINAGDDAAALATWAKYINQAGKPLTGLKLRRQAEIEMYKS